MHSHINLEICYFLSSLESYYFNHCIAFQQSINNTNSCIMLTDRHRIAQKTQTQTHIAEHNLGCPGWYWASQ